MGATCSDVVTGALRLARVIGVNKEPKAAETERGMECLQSLYEHWLSTGMFGRLEDIYLTADDTAKEGKRYFLASGVTLAEPTLISAEGNCDGTDRQPRDLSVYESLTSDGLRTVRLYDRTQWVDLLDLEQDGEAPLASRGQMGLSAALAISGAFTAMFGVGQGINPDVRLLAGQFIASLAYKLGSTRDRTKAEYF